MELYNFWIILTGTIVAVSCALLGSFLVLRNMAMVGDAISHAVLPGIAISFLLTGYKDSLPMLIGAGILGVITTFIIEWLHSKLKLQEDASIGVAFTFLFALGVILITKFADKIDLDQDCVLYGDLSMIPFEQWIINGKDIGPEAFYTGLVNLIILVVLILVCYKELFITSFDPNYAKFIGINAGFWHYVLMSSLSFTTVASFDSVGAILVVAFLVVPPATAYLITTSLKKMLLFSTLFALLSVALGYLFSAVFDSSIAGSMASMAGFIFVLVWIGKWLMEKRREFELVEK